MNIASHPAAGPVSHNKVGQKLGRKGQETRERILAAMLRLIEDPEGPPVTLTSVAKEASVRLPNLYLYFPDMGDLLLTALDRVMDTAKETYLELLQERWPDDGLHEACLRFLFAHYEFWKKNARILHMRNALADASDERVIAYRSTATRPLIDMLTAQMDGKPGAEDRSCANVATVLLTGIERIATVVTNPHFRSVMMQEPETRHADIVRELIEAEAEVIGQAILRRRQIS